MELKPQIVTEVDTGYHNNNLELANGRILKGGTWKKARVVVVIPAGQMISSKVALSHWNLIFPPNQPVHRMLVQGCEVGDAYNRAIDAILSNPELSQWEYLLTIEHDNVPPPDGLVKLIERMEAHPEFDVIGGLYWTKGYGGCPQIWGDIKDPVMNFRPQPAVAGQLVEAYGLGMGFNLWRLSMFKDKDLRRPWFKTGRGLNGEGVHTQDLYFFGDARRCGYRFAVDCDVKVGHFDSENEYCW